MPTTMTTDEVLEVIRQSIGQTIQEIGCDPPVYSDTFLLKYVKSTKFRLEVLGVIDENKTTYTVDTTAITPDPTKGIGMLLATGASASIIRDDLLNRLKNGELGMSFSSGATTITTNQAAINLKSSSDLLLQEFSVLMAAYLSRDPNQFLGRDQ